MIEVVKRLRLCKEPGWDSLSPEMIKYVGEGTTRDMMNEAIKGKEVPKD